MSAEIPGLTFSTDADAAALNAALSAQSRLERASGVRVALVHLTALAGLPLALAWGSPPWMSEHSRTMTLVVWGATASGAILASVSEWLRRRARDECLAGLRARSPQVP